MHRFALLSIALLVLAAVVNAANFNAVTDDGSLAIKTKGSNTEPFKSITFTLPKSKKTYSEAYTGQKVVMSVAATGLVKRLKINKDTITPKFKKNGSLRSLTIKTKGGDGSNRFVVRALQSGLDCSDCGGIFSAFCGSFVATSCTDSVIADITAENEFVGAVMSFICAGGEVFDCAADSGDVCGPVVECGCGEGNSMCDNGECAGPEFDTGCFTCPDGVNQPVELDFRDEPDPDSCCEEGEVYCSVSESCIPETMDCCGPREKFCMEFGRCIDEDALCGISIVADDCSDGDTVYAKCDDNELTCFFACLGFNFELEENAAFGGLVCDEPLGEVEAPNCPDDLGARRLEILRERGLLA